MMLDRILSEKQLAEKFGLKVGKDGRSAVISQWITEGLMFIERGGQRLFWDEDVYDFLVSGRRANSWLTTLSNRRGYTKIGKRWYEREGEGNDGSGDGEEGTCFRG